MCSYKLNSGKGKRKLLTNHLEKDYSGYSNLNDIREYRMFLGDKNPIKKISARPEKKNKPRNGHIISLKSSI